VLDLGLQEDTAASDLLASLSKLNSLVGGIIGG